MKGGLCYQLIPNVNSFIKNNQTYINYLITQAMNDRKNYNQYLHKFKIKHEEDYVMCV